MSITDLQVFLSLGSTVCDFIYSGVIAIHREAALAMFLCHAEVCETGGIICVVIGESAGCSLLCCFLYLILYYWQ